MTVFMSRPSFFLSHSKIILHAPADTEFRQPDLEVTCLNVNEAEVVQHVHSAYLPI